MIGPETRKDFAPDKLFQGCGKPLNIVQIVGIRDDGGPSIPDQVDGPRFIQRRLVRLDDFELFALETALPPSPL